MSSSLYSEADFEAHGGVMLVSTSDVPAPHDFGGYIRLKYVTKTSETNTTGGSVPELNYGTNWRLLRYADVLLLAAEAYHMNGSDGPAQIELAKVRNRAGFAGPVTESGQDLMDLIIEERQVELAFEGNRYWDLIRWGLANEELSDIGFQTGKHEHFPIPLVETIANTAIGAENQNPGY